MSNLDGWEGPKMYAGMVSRTLGPLHPSHTDKQANTHTELHMDHSDAVNLMFYGEAKWWIFEARDAPRVEQYLKEGKGGTCDDDQDFSNLFSGECLLTSQDIKKIQQMYQVTPKVIIQKPGDAIIIPAGCPHQVWEFHLRLETYFQSFLGFKPEGQHQGSR
jgi:[histone H3]-dimethyl-L-lysine9 demethylase